MDNSINNELDQYALENSIASLDKQITNNEDMITF